MDDEDEFLYGGTPTATAGPSAVSTDHMAMGAQLAPLNSMTCD